jgi:hypothetical protein
MQLEGPDDFIAADSVGVGVNSLPMKKNCDLSADSWVDWAPLGGIGLKVGGIHWVIGKTITVREDLWK